MSDTTIRGMEKSPLEGVLTAEWMSEEGVRTPDRTLLALPCREVADAAEIVAVDEVERIERADGPATISDGSASASTKPSDSRYTRVACGSVEGSLRFLGTGSAMADHE